MAFEHAIGGVMQWFMSKLLLPYEQTPRRHGVLLVKLGLVSFGAWLATIFLALWLFLPPEPPPMPDIGPASKGPPVKIAEADRRPVPLEVKLMMYLAAAAAVAIVFWGGYSSLMIAAGVFEQFSGYPFGAINEWFNRLAWYEKIAVFPVLLAAAFLVIGMPFIVFGVVGWFMGL